MYSETGVFAAIRLLVHRFQIIRSKRVIPHRRRRIARVARPRPVILRQKLFANAKLFSHLLELSRIVATIIMLIRRRSNTHRRSSFRSHSSSFRKRQSLPRRNKHLCILHRRSLQNPMPQIQNMPHSAKRRRSLLRRLSNMFSAAKTKPPDPHCPAAQSLAPQSPATPPNPRASPAQNIRARLCHRGQ